MPVWRRVQQYQRLCIIFNSGIWQLTVKELSDLPITSGQSDRKKVLNFIKSLFPPHYFTQRWADFLRNCIIQLMYHIRMVRSEFTWQIRSWSLQSLTIIVKYRWEKGDTGRLEVTGGVKEVEANNRNPGSACDISLLSNLSPLTLFHKVHWCWFSVPSDWQLWVLKMGGHVLLISISVNKCWQSMTCDSL